MFDHITIRPSCPEDALEVERLRIRCWQQDYAGIMDSDFLCSLNPEDSSEGRAKAVALGNHIHTVVVIDERIIGLSDAGARRGVSQDGQEAEIYSFYVRSDYRRYGIGTRLFLYQKERLKEQGYTSLFLAVLKDNHSAIAFYKKMGGKENGEKRFLIGSKEYPEIVFEYAIEKDETCCMT